jgi:hypothetical protein
VEIDDLIVRGGGGNPNGTAGGTGKGAKKENSVTSSQK